MRVSYRNYLLGVLMVIFGCNFAERLALGLMLNEIKTDLALTDTQLGLMTGLAFAVFYALLGIPIARWADRGNRVLIISLGAIVAGTAVAFCGTATTFAQIVLIRACVAAGEAAAIPPAHSLLADSFDRAERPRAAAIYKLGGSLSLIIGYIATGWLNTLYGWRTVFVVLGLPCIVLGIVAWATLQEPRRRLAQSSVGAGAVGPASPEVAVEAIPTLSQAIRALAANATYRNLLLAFAVVGFFNVGIGQWEPSYFVRRFGMGSKELGFWFGACVGFGGALGTLLGGELAARHAVRNETLQLKGIALCYIVLCVAFAAKYLVPTAPLALGLTFITAFVGGLTMGPLFALVQTVVPSRMRATSVAILYMSGTLIGMGLGPLAVGALSDAFSEQAGEGSLRLALLVLTPGYIWGAWQVWRAMSSIDNDLRVHAGVV
jgi:MFS family permease